MNSRKTILLIDDDSRLLKGLERRLEEDGYHVWTAISSSEAAAILDRNPIDVIVCDNRMPGVSGLDFLGRIKRLYPDTKRIMLSGTVGLTQAFQAKAAYGISHVLTKPCSFEILRSAIQQVTADPCPVSES